MDVDTITVLVGAVIVVLWTNRKKIADIIRVCRKAWNGR